MDNYPANIRYKWGVHIVKLKWQIDDYKAEGIAEMGGNCQGGTILDSVRGDIEDGQFEPNMNYPENQKHFILDSDNYLKKVRLFNDKGEETQFDEDFYHDYLVGVEIIGFKEDKR